MLNAAEIAAWTAANHRARWAYRNDPFALSDQLDWVEARQRRQRRRIEAGIRLLKQEQQP